MPHALLCHNCTLATSAVAEWFDCVWLQEFVNELAPPTLQNLVARAYDELRKGGSYFRLLFLMCSCFVLFVCLVFFFLSIFVLFCAFIVFFLKHICIILCFHIVHVLHFLFRVVSQLTKQGTSDILAKWVFGVIVRRTLSALINLIPKSSLYSSIAPTVWDMTICV